MRPPHRPNRKVRLTPQTPDQVPANEFSLVSGQLFKTDTAEPLFVFVGFPHSPNVDHLRR